MFGSVKLSQDPHDVWGFGLAMTSITCLRRREKSSSPRLQPRKAAFLNQAQGTLR